MHTVGRKFGTCRTHGAGQ